MALFQKPRTETFCLQLDTSLAADELSARLRQFEPWGHRIDFSNGVSTRDLQTRTPFSENSIEKLKAVATMVPFDELRGGAVLDVGCDSGHNSIFLASEYAMRPTGIDVSGRHIEASKLLSGIAGIDAEYLIASAETHRDPENFDVVLHFDALQQLPNPLLSLQTTYANLKKGGYLALETQVYNDSRDPNVCYFMHNNDHSNYWALSTRVLKQCLQIVGFREVHELGKLTTHTFAKYMSRIILVAQK